MTFGACQHYVSTVPPAGEGGARAQPPSQRTEWYLAYFLTEIRRDFHARFWEMYLTCTFLQDALRLGYRVSCPKPGPDVLIEYQGRRIWIEATVATDGDPTSPDSAVEDHSGKIPG